MLNKEKHSSNIKIPIDDAITDFKNHLLSHPRTILSAKYGDGKTYFLSKFVNSLSVKEAFCFLTLYPINYQVLPNKDIFELIKRDLLIQMISNGMLETYEIPDNVALSFYLQNQFSTVSEALLPFLQILDTPSPVAKGLMIGLSGLKMLQTLKNKYREWKGQFDEAEKIEDYIIKSGSMIYENDAITEIIRGGIESYKKENSNKNVVLIIEDLDRIDPAHLFRILNVFSAHMDFRYRLGVPEDEEYLVGNKFGLDNVVMVMDYENAHNIFKHFYGDYANFNGYIDKFCSNNYFKYSLVEQKYDYFIKLVIEVTQLSYNLVSKYFNKNDISTKSIRDLSKCFINIDKDLIEKGNPYNKFSKSILRLLVIARRLGLNEEGITYNLKVGNSLHLDEVIKYAGPYLSALSNNGEIGEFGYVNGNVYYVFVNPQLNDDGTLSFTTYTQEGAKPKTIDFSELLQFIAR